MNKTIDERVIAIEQRNKKVELDKAWETSWTRRGSIALLTYIIVLTYLFLIRNEHPFINAAVPAAGFLLSTLLLPQIRAVWQRRHQ